MSIEQDLEHRCVISQNGKLVISSDNLKEFLRENNITELPSKLQIEVYVSGSDAAIWSIIGRFLVKMDVDSLNEMISLIISKENHTAGGRYFDFEAPSENADFATVSRTIESIQSRLNDRRVQDSPFEWKKQLDYGSMFLQRVKSQEVYERYLEIEKYVPLYRYVERNKNSIDASKLDCIIHNYRFDPTDAWRYVTLYCAEKRMNVDLTYDSKQNDTEPVKSVNQNITEEQESKPTRQEEEPHSEIPSRLKNRVVSITISTAFLIISLIVAYYIYGYSEDLMIADPHCMAYMLNILSIIFILFAILSFFTRMILFALPIVMMYAAMAIILIISIGGYYLGWEVTGLETMEDLLVIVIPMVIVIILSVISLFEPLVSIVNAIIEAIGVLVFYFVFIDSSIVGCEEVGQVFYSLILVMIPTGILSSISTALLFD